MRGAVTAADGWHPICPASGPYGAREEMKVLVTGGTGVIGESAVRELHAAGHQVRVLSRHAGRDQKWWPAGVDGWAGDVSNQRSIEGAADGCDAVLHIAGIVEEKPPAITF